jgi:outer membrane protein TolC
VVQNGRILHRKFVVAAPSLKRRKSMTHGKIVRTLTIFSGLSLPVLVAGQVGPAPTSSYQSLPPAPAQPTEGQFQESVPQGQATPNTIPLTLEEAINRGLKANLGLLVSEQADRQAQATRIHTLAGLLPTVTGSVTENVAQINLKTFGFNFNFPGINIPSIVGPVNYNEARAYAKVPVLDLAQRRNFLATKEQRKAAELSIKDARDLVVESVGNAYLKIIADGALVDSTQAQVNTAQVLFDRASDQKKAGTSPGIDVLRSNVELKRQQQLLLAERNQLEKDKLVLARVIGLPPGQQFSVADPSPDAPLATMTLEDALHNAYDQRSDYQAAQASVRAAELAKRAAKAQWYPTVTAEGNYGVSGTYFTESHGVFTFLAGVNFNVYDGGRIKADVLQADVILTNRRNDLENLRGHIDFQVRSSLLDLKSAQDQVEVAKSNVTLAGETLAQARDRFTAGVADNLEVVQAQQSVASAEQDLISAQYQNNLARVELARALGLAEMGVRGYFTNRQPGQLAPQK